LTREDDASSRKIEAKRIFVDRLYKSGSEDAMDFHRLSDHLACQIISHLHSVNSVNSVKSPLVIHQRDKRVAGAVGGGGGGGGFYSRLHAGEIRHAGVGINGHLCKKDGGGIAV